MRLCLPWPLPLWLLPLWLLPLSASSPTPNSTLPKYAGVCELERARCPGLPGSFCPQCDASGYFLSQQCWAATGFCWCVHIVTGEEIPGTRTPAGVLPVDCAAGVVPGPGAGLVRYCPHAWSSYDRKCYVFIDVPKRWLEAELYCQFDGGNLASVHDHEENRFIMTLTRDSHDFPETWIGGVAPVLPGIWFWSDGSKFFYEIWDQTQDIRDPGNSCAVMNHGYNFKWRPTSCEELRPFVCSKPI